MTYGKKKSSDDKNSTDNNLAWNNDSCKLREIEAEGKVADNPNSQSERDQQDACFDSCQSKKRSEKKNVQPENAE